MEGTGASKIHSSGTEDNSVGTEVNGREQPHTPKLQTWLSAGPLGPSTPDTPEPRAARGGWQHLEYLR